MMPTLQLDDHGTDLKRFVALMAHYMPEWQFYRDTLNRLPVRHESWYY